MFIFRSTNSVFEGWRVDFVDSREAQGDKYLGNEVEILLVVVLARSRGNYWYCSIPKCAVVNDNE